MSHLVLEWRVGWDYPVLTAESLSGTEPTWPLGIFLHFYFFLAANLGQGEVSCSGADWHFQDHGCDGRCHLGQERWGSHGRSPLLPGLWTLFLSLIWSRSSSPSCVLDISFFIASLAKISFWFLQWQVSHMMTKLKETRITKLFEARLLWEHQVPCHMLGMCYFTSAFPTVSWFWAQFASLFCVIFCRGDNWGVQRSQNWLSS